jgi:hypothetical protein
LLFAQILGGRRSDGFFYVRIGRSGTMSGPVRLGGPAADDDPRIRHLSADKRGRPYALWLARGGIVVESLAGIAD